MAVFANILKTLRTDKHLSQQELATRLGISKSAVSMYEQGRREPDFDILNKIADIFQVDADYLLGRSSLSHESEPVTIAAHLDNMPKISGKSCESSQIPLISRINQIESDSWIHIFQNLILCLIITPPQNSMEIQTAIPGIRMIIKHQRNHRNQLIRLSKL